jgi:hypothetical protein
MSSGPATSRARREVASASAPDGTSRTNPVIDHSANSDEISAVDRPASPNSSA